MTPFAIHGVQMTANQKNDVVGDSKAPPLSPNAAALRDAVDQANAMVAESAPKLKVQSVAASLTAATKKTTALPPDSCQQYIWLSFFFDGTGNNLDADVGTQKHSNVAKLYRAHTPTTRSNGIYGIYIPGVGTYFKEVGDDGGSTLGLGTGRMGDARLDWALKQFDKLLSPHIARAKSPGNTIREVNVALFGFSRGAALARAFSNHLLRDRCTQDKQGNWRLKNGGYRLRIRFMGIFDTVASVGLPMSTNNVSVVATAFGVKQIIDTRLLSRNYIACWPQALAYAKGAAPGADPAPGVYDGHSDWGGLMAIPHMVEDVRHFIAAHELRNSFPVDSVSVLVDGRVAKPEQFHETVFPGVHSDVGGSYRPGEGARSLDGRAKLGLIPLHNMYQLAVDAGVPLLPKTAWGENQFSDFDMDPSMLELYNYYQSKVRGMSNLGPLMNAHMSLYYAWRFRAIRRKANGDSSEAAAISRKSNEFQAERVTLDQQIAGLGKKNDAAMRALSQADARRTAYLQSNYGNPDLPDLKAYDQKIAEAKSQYDMTKDELLRAKAKRDALPDMTKFASLVQMYDQQLLADVQAIRQAYTAKGLFGGAPNTGKRQELRPHYRALMDAYENEYIHNNGLKDEKIISFFDNLVHDSLSGFAKDATLPSDPRVVYLGGDEKYKYAMIEKKPGADVLQYASVDQKNPTEAAV